MIVVGLMSGTSADGIDAAVVEINGRPPALQWRLLSHHAAPHAHELRAAILTAAAGGTADLLCRLNFELGRVFGAAALDAIAAAGLSPEQVDVIGSHGQTVWHAPHGPVPSTLQLGEPAVIAEMTGIPVISDFRVRDMAAGGQGAPLVAYIDQLLFTHPRLTRALQNLGGIANVTFVPPASGASADRLASFAFDTGPGNMLIDDAAGRASEGRLAYDVDGRLAACGRVDEGLLAELLADPYFAAPPPKTTGREYFGAAYGAGIWARGAARGLAPADVVATVTALTGFSIRDAYRRFLPAWPDEVVLSGGGAANPVLVGMLREALAPAAVIISDELSLGSQAKEAVAFAVLAYETWHHRPGNLPSATGAHHPVVLGAFTPGGGRSYTLGRAPRTVEAAGPAPTTEARNPASAEIDAVPTEVMLRIINAEDQRVAEVVEAQIPAIARAVDAVAARMRKGGRLIYMGAGTSGRLGVLDASECPPTFSTSPGQVLGLIAGGLHALTHATEGAEDDTAAGAHDIASAGVGPNDTVIGIAASGRTPYVLAGLRAARLAGALTVSIAANHPSPMVEAAEIAIPLVVGPEVITGSTRLKAGTSQKMVLNMISTGVMIRLGKTFGNLMVDVQATNAKLRVRARRIVEDACGVDATTAAALLDSTDGEVKTAILVGLTGLAPGAARDRLAAVDGSLRSAIGSA